MTTLSIKDLELDLKLQLQQEKAGFYPHAYQDLSEAIKQVQASDSKAVNEQHNKPQTRFIETHKK
ncbi:MAG: hypothetical protein ABGX53_03390 [Candidatus Thioglobus sp.]|jgi:hypothetical protein|nr:hypothetical protein [Methylococcaceae bacterium]